MAQLLQVPVCTSTTTGSSGEHTRPRIQASHEALAGATAHELRTVITSGASGPAVRAYACTLAKLICVIPLMGGVDGASDAAQQQLQAAATVLDEMGEDIKSALGVTAARELAAAVHRLRQITAENARADNAAALAAVLSAAEEAHRELLVSVAFPFASSRQRGKNVAPQNKLILSSSDSEQEEEDNRLPSSRPKKTELGRRSSSPTRVGPRRSSRRVLQLQRQAYASESDDEDQVSTKVGKENTPRGKQEDASPGSVSGIRKALAENRLTD